MSGRLNVLIPTSGQGSRLGELTEYTNKALVRVGTKAVVSHIIDAYPKDTRFYVMLGHKGDLVRQYLTLAHPWAEIEYLDQEMMAGENLGLVKALRLQQHELPAGGLIFHASDTIVTVPEEFLATQYNAVLGYRMDGDTHDYRMIRSDGRHTVCNFAQRILEKGEQTTCEDMVHIGVVRFSSTADFCRALDTCEDFDCDTHILNKSVENGGSRFSAIEAKDWYDTGNMSKLTVARKHFEDPAFVLLEKIDQGVYIIGDRVVKFFARPEMVSHRIQRAKHINGLPEILGVTENFFAYQKAEGDMAREVMHPLMFRDFLNWAQDNLWPLTQPDTEIFGGNAKMFYYFKTLARVNQFYEKTGLTDQADIINGQRVPSLAEMLDRLNWARYLAGAWPCEGMHGDLHFSNILVQDGGYALLDWRESFGASLRTGDAYYDLGKLLHGLIVSHDLVERDLFTVQIQDGSVREVTLDIMRHQRLVLCEAMLKEWVAENGAWDWWQVRMTCALIYLNIATLHHHPYDKFLYFLGKSMMHELIYRDARDEGPD